MDQLHLAGVSAIQNMQEAFKDHSDVMLFMTRLGDPRLAFLVYFPLTYCWSARAGVQVLWIAVISEWLNAVLKWVLLGERPYWWTAETALYTAENRPALQQYPLTCELGPGSPSGHAMVTAAVIFTMLSSFLNRDDSKSNTSSNPWSLLIWLAFTLFMGAVCLSRCFIATHFPHQVVAGTIVGIILACGCQRLPLLSITLPKYLVCTILLLVGNFVVYWGVQVVGIDPLWSTKLGMKHCARKEWIHLDTTLWFAVIRDTSSLIGLGIALNIPSQQELESAVAPPIGSKIIATVACLCVTLSSEYIPLPKNLAVLFYCCAFIKYLTLTYFVVSIVPKLIGFAGKNNQTPKFKNH